jgi:hypothetical protein
MYAELSTPDWQDEVRLRLLLHLPSLRDYVCPFLQQVAQAPHHLSPVDSSLPERLHSPVPTHPSNNCEPSKTCTCALYRPRKLYLVFPRDFFAFHAAFFFFFFSWGGGDALVNFIQIARILITADCTSTATFLSVRASSLFPWPFTCRVLPIASTATLRSCCKQPQRRILPLWPGVSGCHRASSSADPPASHLAGTIHGHRGLCEQGSTRNQTDKRLKFASLETASQATENKNILRKSPPLSWCTFVRNNALKHP